MYSIEVKLTGIEALKKSDVNRALIKAGLLTGRHFRHVMLPSRFTVAGGRRLKYTPRSGESAIGRPRDDKKSRRLYAYRKLKTLGHSDPFVFSGDGKREALSNPMNVRSTRNSITIPLPRKFNRSNPKSKIRMADEIRRVTTREANQLAKQHVIHIETQLALLAGSSRFRRVSSVSITGA